MLSDSNIPPEHKIWLRKILASDVRALPHEQILGKLPLRSHRVCLLDLVSIKHFRNRLDKVFGYFFTARSLARSCLPFSYPSVLHERRHLIKARSFSKASRKGFGSICDQMILFV